MTSYDDVYKRMYESIPAPLYVPELLSNIYRQQNTATNRDWLVKQGGFAYKICRSVPEKIFKNPLIFLNEKEEPMPDKQAKWMEENGKEVWTETMAQDRTHGWCLQKEYRAPARFSYYIGQKSKTSILSTQHLVEVNRDENGDIVEYHIQYDMDDGEIPSANNTNQIEYRLLPEEVTHIESIPQENHWGISMLTKGWAHIIAAEETALLMKIFDDYLRPFVILPVPRGMDAGAKADLEEKFETMPLRRGMTQEMDENGNIHSPTFMEAHGQSNHAEHLEMYIKLIAADAEMPQRMLVGSEAGALASSEQDALQEQNYLEAVFRKYERQIRQWCIKHAILSKGEKVILRPDLQMAMTDKDKKEVELKELSKTEQYLNFMTINEIRQKNQLPDFEGGNVILALQNRGMDLNVNGLEPPEEEQEEEIKQEEEMENASESDEEEDRRRADRQ